MLFTYRSTGLAIAQSINGSFMPSMDERNQPFFPPAPSEKDVIKDFFDGLDDLNDDDADPKDESKPLRKPRFPYLYMFPLIFISNPREENRE